MKKSKTADFVKILVIAIITLFFAMQLPKLVISNDVSIFIPEDNPVRVAFDELSEEFGRLDAIAIGIEAKEAPIYSGKNLKIIESITEKLEEVDSVESITSLTNIDYVTGTEFGLEVTELIDYIPESKEEEEALRKKLESWDVYKNNLYTKGFKGTVILVEIPDMSEKGDEAVYTKIMEIVKPYSENFDFYVAGSPVVYSLVGKNMMLDLTWLVPLVALIVILSLFLSFGRLSGVIIPLTTVLISTVWTLGLMSLTGTDLTLISTIIPVLMIAVGSAYGIHIMSHYFDDMKKADEDITEEQHNEIIHHTMKSIGRAVMLAAITTMIGFGSLYSSDIIPIKDFGIFTFVGVFVAYIVSIILIPSILRVKHSSKKLKVGKESFTDKGINAILHIYGAMANHKAGVIIGSTIIIAISVYGLSNIKIGNSAINNFKENTLLWQANNWLQENTNGTVTIHLKSVHKEVGGMASPEALQMLVDLEDKLREKHPKSYGEMISLADYVKRMNQVMHGDSLEYNEIPTNPKKYGWETSEDLQMLISQYLMMFSGSLEDYTDDQIEPTVAHSIIQLSSDDVDSIKAVVGTINEWILENENLNIKTSLSGNAISEVEVTDLVVGSQVKSVIFSLFAVFLILTIYYRSIIAGVLGVFVLGIPVTLNFGIMGIIGISLNTATAMIASIAIGIGVDYVIHFINSLSHIMKKGDSTLEEAIKLTIFGSGKAILFNAFSVAFGFSVIMFSQFLPLVHLGGMIALTMITSSLASMTLLPVLVMIIKPKFLKK